ncbi:PAP2_superfamily protein [Hexamita inflata]|uniref:PAP2 superfamily protein n=1 Tax=Hexamita inflata TaxID=28002 RepID=A0AA86U3Q9_9EUKA|nr:PAP2 superfamily protein [Hexamita inflata]
MKKVFIVSSNYTKLILAITVVLIGILTLILISSFSAKLSSLDKGLAQWAQSQSILQTEDYKFNTGAVFFINAYLAIIFVISIIIVLALVLYDIFALRLSISKHLFTYVYILAAYIAYFVLSIILLLILKSYFRRPRPYQTLEFYPVFSTDLQCKLPFQLSFRRYSGPNPCSYPLESCPSGHTLITAVSYFSMLWFSVFNFKFTRKFVHKKYNTFLHIICIFLTTCLTVIFVPTVIIARMSVLMHFLTDVLGGLGLSVAFFGVLMFFEPDFQVCAQIRADKIIRGNGAQQ